MRFLFIALMLLLLIPAIGSPAQSAEFDCAKAAMPTDFVICSDARLLEANDAHAHAWHQARAVLDAAGKKDLVATQKVWLKELTAACRLPDRGKPSVETIAQARDCVFKGLRERTAALDTIAGKGSAAPAPAAGSELSERQLKQIHQEVCRVPPRQGSAGGWSCDIPRAYKNASPDGECLLSFGPSMIYYGRFTENTPQALAVYQAACEPHANNGGGMALFRVADGAFKLIRYYIGIVPEDCVVPPAEGGRLQKLYCLYSYLGNGESSEEFGPLEMDGEGRAAIRPLLSAGNIDAQLMTTATACPRPKPEIHDLVGLSADGEGNMVVEGRYLSPRSVAAACQRFQRKDFSEEEATLRENSRQAGAMAFIREDEVRYLKVLATFGPDGRRKGLAFTSRDASAEP